MAKDKNYWDEMKKESFYIYSKPKGYEVKVSYEETWSYIPKKHQQVMRKKHVLAIYKGIPIEDRKSVRDQYAFIKRCAQACKDKEQYRDLLRRIPEKSDKEHIIKNDLTGSNLITWAFTTPTNSEYQNSFWNS